MKKPVLKIQAYREAAGMNKTELAKKMGVSIPTVSRWESGEDYPAGPRLPILAKTLGCTIDELFGRTPSGRDSV